jgi:hypothetical protein
MIGVADHRSSDHTCIARQFCNLTVERRDVAAACTPATVLDSAVSEAAATRLRGTPVELTVATGDNVQLDMLDNNAVDASICGVAYGSVGIAIASVPPP